MQKHGAKGAYIVTSGTFTGSAREFARDLPVWLITGQNLRALIHEGMEPGSKPGKLELTPSPLADGAKTCPDCHGRMILRTASKGANTGQKFWGCSDYPNCSGTRPA